MTKLTGTSYAVLALLARRPYSAYELTNELKVSLSQCMPRSATLLYREPKKLVTQGFVSVESQLKGRQKRAVYSITDAGRAALAQWFTQPAAPPLFESEVVVRLIFGHLGSRAELTASLAELEAQVQEWSLRNVAAFDGWFDRFPPGAEHLADLAVMSRLYLDLYGLLAEWSRWARAEIAARPETWPPGAEQELMAALQKLFAHLGDQRGTGAGLLELSGDAANSMVD